MSASSSTPRRVAVIGAGTIGASWVAAFLARGMQVTASDPSPGAPDLIRRMVESAWPALQRLGLSEGADPTAWRFESSPEAAAEGAEFVQESAPERLEVKQPLLARIDAVLPPEVVIGSSTSGLLVSRLSELCRHPERVVIGHPFNPPHMIPLVEVVGGAKASPEAVARAVAFYRAAGKHPIVLNKEVKGHLANRLQAALWREALYMLQEGVASVADIDAAISEGPGLRWALMGPNKTFHLAGGEGGMTHFLSHLVPAMQTWWDDLGAPDITPEFGAKLIQGIREQTNDQSIAEMAKWRDEMLVRLLEARTKP